MNTNQNNQNNQNNQHLPQFHIDQQVYRVHYAFDITTTECLDCTNGTINITNKAGVTKKYKCPECHGSGKIHISKPKAEVLKDKHGKPQPLFVTGYRISAEKQHGILEINATYYLDTKIDPQHSVYLDSTGDLQVGPNEIFTELNDAINHAKFLNENAQNEQLLDETEDKPNIHKIPYLTEIHEEDDD